MQAGDIFRRADHRLAGAGGFADVFGQIEVDRLDTAFLEYDARGLAGGERQAFGFGVGVTDDLVAPFGLVAAAVGGIDGAFVAPDADKLLERCAQHIGVIIAGAIVTIGHEDEARVVEQAVMPAPVTAERARHGDVGLKLVIDEAFDLGIAGFGEQTGEIARRPCRQDDRAGYR